MDSTDYGFLTAARFFFLAFSGLDHSAWVAAILGGESFFPGEHSAEKMRRALAVVHEMCCARVSCFHFSNPRCAKCATVVTHHESYLLQIVQNARRGQTSRAIAIAMMLCEGNDIDAVISAAQGFAELVPSGAPLVQA